MRFYIYLMIIGVFGTISHYQKYAMSFYTTLIIGHELLLSMIISRIISGYDTISIVLAKGSLNSIRIEVITGKDQENLGNRMVKRGRILPWSSSGSTVRR